MGGCIASLYLEKYGQDFDAAVLCSPMDELALGFLPFISVEIIEIEYRLGHGEEYAPGEHGYDDSEKFSNKCLTHSELRWGITRREFGENPSAKLGGPSVLWVKLAQEAGLTARNNASDVKVPVLLLQAGKDTIVEPEGQNDFRDRVNKAHPGFCRLELIEGASHEMLVESDLYRKRVFEFMLDFIRNHTP
jgi:lysophospholipase